MPPDLLVLIDMDPPSEEGDGSRGFYPARPGPPPPEPLMQYRFETCFDFVRTACAGRAMLTVHTSPRYRNDFLCGPYPARWREAQALGCDLALHPHEDRVDGGSFYGDLAHMCSVIEGALAQAGRVGLRFAAFRSGTFAWGAAMPRLLSEFGFRLDLSALPGSRDWPANIGPYLLAPDLLEVPLGWNGRGHDFERDTLFNEKADLAALQDVWDALRSAPEPPIAVNFLCHGFGLVQQRWRDQAEAFLDHVRSTGGTLLSAARAHERCLAGEDT